MARKVKRPTALEEWNANHPESKDTYIHPVNYSFYISYPVFQAKTKDIPKKDIPRVMVLWAINEQLLITDYKDRGWVLYRTESTLRVRSYDDITGNIMLLFHTIIPDFSNPAYPQLGYVIWQGWLPKWIFMEIAEEEKIDGVIYKSVKAIDLLPPRWLLCQHPRFAHIVVSPSDSKVMDYLEASSNRSIGLAVQSSVEDLHGKLSRICGGL